MAKASSCLFSLPPEVLCSITGLLPGSDIARLYASGSAALNRLLTAQGGVKEFVVNYNPPVSFQFPTIASRFPKLESFHLICRYDREIENLDLTCLPTTLKSLILPITPVKLASMTMPLYTQLISRHFPCLEILSLSQQSYVETTASFLDGLPKCLTSLQLPNVRPASLVVLPPYLRHLDISIKEDDPKVKPSVYILPETLVSLKATQLPDLNIMDSLPRELESLELVIFDSFYFEDHGTAEDVEHWKRFPHTLTRLTLPCRQITPELAALLPPELTFLNVEDREGLDADSAVEVLENLPRTLLEFDLNAPEAVIADIEGAIRALPPDLQVIPDWLMIDPNEHLQLVPKSTRQILLNCQSFELPFALPCLQVLDIFTVQVNSFNSGVLPPTLTTLTAEMFDIGTLLKCLLRSDCQLTTLKCSISDILQLQLIPPTLTQATMTIAADQPIQLDLSLLYLTSLRHLYINMGSAIISSIPLCLPTSITSLSLYPAEFNAERLVDLSGLKRLETLSLRCVLGVINERHVASLPRSLLSLDLYPSRKNDHEHPLQLSEEEWRSVPPLLTRLSVPWNANDPHPKLPPNLRFLISFHTNMNFVRYRREVVPSN